MSLPFNIPIEFVLFALMLLGVALFHRRTLEVALAGLVATLAYKLLYTDLVLLTHLAHEWRLLANLCGLLLGFAILARHFEDSHFPELLPNWLPDDWRGGLVLLVIVALLSIFLDNIAAAMIGAVMAKKVFNNRVSTGYLAALVASANAGGAGSVIGDTTTTMMWIAGVPALHVADAFIAAAVAVAFSGVVASRAQHRLQPISKTAHSSHTIDSGHLWIVVLIIAGATLGNIAFDFPALGVWIAILIGALFRRTGWKEARVATPGAIFLLALTFSASLMPVQALPAPSWQTVFGIGFVSAVFNNIPLTALALHQGGYDWGVLAYAIGYGGSIIWFGSSAGVAVCTIFPAAKNTWRWIKEGWHVAVAYVLGFFALLMILGWEPDLIPL